MNTQPRRSLRVVGLFAGIGGLELGLERSGHSTELLCELDQDAQAVLRKHFAGIPLRSDVRDIRRLPKCDLIAAGFPCQDLSLAGTQAGLAGSRSSLVNEVFRLARVSKPEFVLLENVLYLVKREKGRLIRYVTDQLEELGYRWAYRVVDSRGFGLPQRRQRVIILASRGDIDPATVLFRKEIEADIDDRILDIRSEHMYGFYWTEGKRAVGWAVDAVPTIKGGSGLGIPSPPAIFDPKTRLTGTPSIRDGERLQGFRPGWTNVERDGSAMTVGRRWSMVGNAVSVPLATWVGDELARPARAQVGIEGKRHVLGNPMPFAASGERGAMKAYDLSLHVKRHRHQPIGTFLRDPLKPLSQRALNGFLQRVEAGVMALPQEMIESLRKQAAN